MTIQTKHIYEFGPFHLDTAERLLQRDGKPVALTPKAFDVLVLLVERSGHLVEKDVLINQVWADSFVEEGNLKVTISMLRKVLNDSTEPHQYIETVPRRGYRFVADVRASSTDAGLVVHEVTRARVTIEEKEEPPSQQEAINPPATIKRKPGRIAQVVIAGMAVVGLSVAGNYYWANREAPGNPVKSIAVLPFKPLVTDDHNEYLELGMTETLITKLGKLRQTTVRPISAVLKYANLEQDALAAGRELKAEAVLDGKLQKLGDHIRVTVTLLDTSDGRVIWAEQFDEKSTDIFKVQDSISERVAKDLAVKITEDERQRLLKHATESLEAYEFYAKGRVYLYQLNETSGFKAIESFSQAIALDPNYAPAYAGLADVYALASDNFLPPAQAMPQAREYTRKALAADDSLDEAHLSLAQIKWWGDWDKSDAEAEFKRAIQLNTSYAMAHFEYGRFLTQLCRFDEAIAQLKTAQEIDPLSVRNRYEAGWIYYCARQYDRAIEWYREALSMDTGSAQTHRRLGLALAQKGMRKEAVAEILKALAIREDASYESDLGWLFATLGQRGEAQKALKKLQELAGRKYVSPYYEARIYAGLGDKERVFQLLKKAYEERSDHLLHLQNDPVFDALRKEPQFIELLGRIGLGS